MSNKLFTPVHSKATDTSVLASDLALDSNFNVSLKGDKLYVFMVKISHGPSAAELASHNSWRMLNNEVWSKDSFIMESCIGMHPYQVAYQSYTKMKDSGVIWSTLSSRWPMAGSLFDRDPDMIAPREQESKIWHISGRTNFIGKLDSALNPDGYMQERILIEYDVETREGVGMILMEEEVFSQVMKRQYPGFRADAIYSFEVQIPEWAFVFWF